MSASQTSEPQRAAFFYGTLMAPEVLYRVLFSTTKPQKTQIESLKIHPALLHHYSRHRVSGCDYPAIVLGTGNACVRGTYVEGLTKNHIRRLDVFEGDQYTRVKVQCQLLLNDSTGAEGGSAELVEAETYVWEMGMEELEESEWDFAEFRREKLRWWVGGEEYAEVDEAVANGFADPTGGRRTGGDVDKKLNEEVEQREVLGSAV